MGRLAAKAPVVAVVLAGIVAIGIIDNDYLLIPIAGNFWGRMRFICY